VTSSPEVAAARVELARIITTELPALENAIEMRDFDAALERATRVRGARTQIRGLLGGGDQVGLLRADWSKIEPRIEAALIQSPRLAADRETARTQWTARLARGTGSPSTPRAATPTVQARGKRGSTRGRTRSTSAGMAAVANATSAEVYYPPGSGGAGAAGRTARGSSGDFVEEPPTKRVPRKQS
jgi:hypothetical protein